MSSTTVSTAPTSIDPSSGPPTPTQRVLTSALVIAPLMYLAADSTYAARGWTDPAAGVIHVLAAIAYGFVVLRVASWLPPASRLAAVVLVTGLIGMAGNVAYGFETIRLSLGDVQLVDRAGAANLIKPLGLFFRLGHGWQGGLVLLATLGWPIAHIDNIAAAAIPVNIALVVAFGSLVARSGTRVPSGGPRDH